MDESKLNWCCKQSKGIKIMEPNDNLAKEYIQSAEETLIVLQTIKGQSNMWIATTKYYCEYFAIYALLMKLGIKCEIHDCTIELTKFIEKMNLIPKGFAKTLEEDKTLRIDNQYYLKNRNVNINPNTIRDFVLVIKNRINTITLEEINQFRKKLKEELG